MDHITITMNPKDNIFTNNLCFRESFNKVFDDIGATTYADSTISKSLSTLKRLTIIEGVPKRRGTYRVNPVYFVRGSEAYERHTHRDKLIVEQLEKDTYKKVISRDNS